MMTQVEAGALHGRRVLLVEDEYFIANEMARNLQEVGVEVVGPVANIEDAITLIEESDGLDAAILDLNLQGEMAFPVADALKARNVPFVFATGYDQAAIPLAYAYVVRCEKPVAPIKVVAALFR
jgi:DNA-binding response OmpR family regulator